jgi:hypothetical protein
MILLSRVALKLLYDLQRLCVNTENLRLFFCKIGFMGQVFNDDMYDISFFTILWYAKMDFQIGRKNYV